MRTKVGIGSARLTRLWVGIPAIALAIVLLVAGCAHMRNPLGKERFLIRVPDLAPVAGQRFTTATQTSADIQTIRIVRGIKDQTNISQSLDFRADYLIVSADTNSQSAEIDFTVGRLESVLGGVTNVLLSGGDVVKAKFLLGERFFTRAGGALPLAAEQALEQVIAPMGGGMRDPDGHFSGLDRPRAVGESWTVDDRNAKKELLGGLRWLSENLSPDDLTLRFEFVGFTNVLGNECFHLRLDCAVTSTTLPSKFRPPPHFRWSKQHTSIHGAVDFALSREGAPRLLWGRLIGEMHVSGIASGLDGDAPLKARMRIERSEFPQLPLGADGGTE